MAVNAGDIIYTVDADTSKFMRGMSDVDQALLDANRNMNRTDDASRALGGGMTALASAISGVLAVSALVDEFKKAISVTMEFNATISNLSSLTGAVGKDLEVFRQAAIAIGGSTSLSATQAAEAMKLIGSASPDLLKSADALKMVTQQAVTLAEAAGSTLPQAADAVTGALNMFQLGADQAARVINVLAAGAKEGASEIDTTVEAMKNAGVVAAQSGLSFEQFNGAIQALAQGQIKGAEAGTGLRNVLTILNTQAKSELRPSIVGLSTAMENLEKAGLDDTQMVKLFGRENITVAKVMLQFRGTMDGVTQAITGTSEAYKQAAINQDNLRGDVANLSSAFETLQIAVGDMSDNTLRELTKQLTDMLNGFTENKDTLVDFFDNAAIAGMAFAAVMAGRIVMSLGAYTYAQIASIKATLESVAANQAAVGATLRRAAVEKEAAIAAVAVARAEFQAAQGTGAHALAADALVAAQLRAGQSATAYAAAQNAANAAATRGTIAMNGLKGAMAFLGGPAGLIMLAAVAIYYFASGAKSARVEVDALTGSLDKLSFSQLGRASGEITDQIAGLNKELALARNNVNTLSKTPWETDDAFKQRQTDVRAALDDVNQALEARKARLAEIADQQKKLSTPAAQAPDKDPARPTLAASDTSDEGQKGLDSLRKQLELAKLIGDARARMAAIQALGDTATEKEKKEAADLASQIYALETAKKKVVKTDTEASQQRKKDAAAEKKAVEENAKAITDYAVSIGQAAMKGEDLARAQAVAKLNKFATPEDVKTMSDLASAMYRVQQAQENKQLLGQVDPMAGEQQSYTTELENLQKLNDAKLLSDQRYLELKAQAETTHLANMALLQEENFKAASYGNELLMNSIDALAQGGGNALSGLLSGTTSLQDAMGGLANTVLNTVIGSFVQAGVEWVKQEIMKQAAVRATEAAQIAGIATVTSAQMGATTAIAATTTTTAAVTGTAVATSMAPAAGLSSIASFGGAAVIGGAALLGTMLLAKSFGGGRRYGGGVDSGSMYQVNESGRPEIFNASNGKQYMMPNTKGEVVSNRDATSGGGAGGAVEVNVHNYTGEKVSQTSTQLDSKRVIDIIVGDMMSGGQSGRAVNDITGTRRPGS